MLALGNFTVRFSNAISNRLFYRAWNEERKNLNKAITHQKHLNTQLSSEQQFISAILNNTSAIVAVIDHQGCMSRINPYGERFTGYSQDEIASEPYFWIRFVPQMLQSEVVAIVENAKRGNIVSRHQNSWITKDAQERMFDWSNALVKNSNGEMEYIVTVGIDITEDIEQQKRVEHALEMAQNAAKAKGEFLANMSHEIRTPMNAILGFTQLLAKTELNERQKKYIDIMSTSSKTLLGIINDILDFSKLESGKFELDITPINPFIEFEKISMMFMTKIEEKRISFELHIDANISLCINLDLLRVQQIISNLLSNAIKFTAQEGTILLYVELLEQLSKKQRIRIGVKDSGIGISQEQQERIFEAFSQADGSTTRKFGGTGLGLSISTRLVSLMGSKLEVESKEGVGSHFFFDMDVESC